MDQKSDSEPASLMQNSFRNDDSLSDFLHCIQHRKPIVYQQPIGSTADEEFFGIIALKMEVFLAISEYFFDLETCQEEDSLCTWFSGLLTRESCSYRQKFVIQYIPTMIWSYLNRSVFSLTCSGLNFLLLHVLQFSTLKKLENGEDFTMPNLEKNSIYSAPIIGNFRPFDDSIWFHIGFAKTSEVVTPYRADVNDIQVISDTSSSMAFRVLVAGITLYTVHNACFPLFIHETFLNLSMNMTSSNVQLQIINEDKLTITWGKVRSAPVPSASGVAGILEYLQESRADVDFKQEKLIKQQRFILDRNLVNCLLDGLITTLSGHVPLDISPLAYSAVVNMNLRARERMLDKIVLITDGILEKIKATK